jgi:hypothetical protein
MTDFPQYSYADELMSPREIGISVDPNGSIDSIMRAVGGINYYADAIAFGESTVFAKQQGMTQNSLGIRFFAKTGAKCSNGADMYEYVDNVPRGIGGRVGKEVELMGLPNLRGMGPGILEDATSSLNPIPLLDAAINGGYAKCKQVQLPVGDANGRVASRFTPNTPWIKDPVQMVNGVPHQTRWVLDKWLSQEDYDAEAKTRQGTGEGFQSRMESLKTSQVAATILLVALVGGLYLIRKK